MYVCLYWHFGPYLSTSAETKAQISAKCLACHVHVYVGLPSCCLSSFYVLQQALMSSVVQAMSHTTGAAGKMFDALASAHVNVRAIAQGSSERNITAVIDRYTYMCVVKWSFRILDFCYVQISWYHLRWLSLLESVINPIMSVRIMILLICRFDLYVCAPVAFKTFLLNLSLMCYAIWWYSRGPRMLLTHAWLRWAQTLSASPFWSHWHITSVFAGTTLPRLFAPSTGPSPCQHALLPLQ